MSVTQPADSGGADVTVQSLQVDDKSVCMPETVSWAQLMEEDEEQYDVGDEEGTDEVDNGESSRSPERKQRYFPEEPPFKAQITNVPIRDSEEEIFYYFGGELAVKSIEVFASNGKAELEFFSKEALMAAAKKDGSELEGRKVRVFVQRNLETPGRIIPRRSTDNDSYPVKRDSYRGSHYNSQNSINSDKHSRYSKDGYRDHRSNNYGTMPAGGYHDRRQNSSRGGHNNHFNNDVRSNFKHPRAPNYPSYERQHSGPQYSNRYAGDNGGPLQRSGSYQHNRNDSYSRNGAPISSRSRNESHSTNIDSYSRTSSRMSIDEPQKIVARKPSANPFGDAKPVDTQSKLLEREQRELEKKKAEEEARKSQSVQNLSEMSSSMEKSIQEEHVVSTDDNQNKQRYPAPPRHQNQHKYHNQSTGYHNQKNYHHKENLYEADNAYEHPTQQTQRRGSFEQGAPPGSVTIKKREPAEHRDDECSTPPVDPIQYPVVNEQTVVTQNEPTEKSYNSLPPHNPNHGYNKQTKNSVRPSTRTYVPRSGHNLQKSATMGQIEKGPRNEHDSDYRANRKNSMGDRKSTRGYRNDTTRRPSFSGSDGGKGETVKSRGMSTKRGMRGGGSTRGSGMRGGRGGGKRSEGDRLISDQGSETIPEVKKDEVKEEKKVQEEIRDKKEEPKKELKEVVNEKGDNGGDGQKTDDSSKNTDSSIQQTQQSAQKKKDKKKEKKKEAKNSQVAGNKFAALLDCQE